MPTPIAIDGRESKIVLLILTNIASLLDERPQNGKTSSFFAH